MSTDVFYLCHMIGSSFAGKPFETKQLLNYASSSVISAIVYGRRFEYADPQLRNIVDRANESVLLSGTASVQVCISSLKHTQMNKILLYHVSLD